MATRFGRETWSVLVPDGWQARHDDECATLLPPGGGAAFQISAAFKDAEVLDADLQDFASEKLESSARPSSTRAGDFVGFEIQFNEPEALWRYWYLRNGRQMLFVTYNCTINFRGRDDDSIDRALDSLVSSDTPNKPLQPTPAAGPNEQPDTAGSGRRG